MADKFRQMDIFDFLDETCLVEKPTFKKQVLLKDLPNIPKNGYKVISTFSGCGGSSLGYKLAGYDVRCAVEFIPKAAETYRVNFPDTPVIEKDIRQITAEELMDVAKIQQYELDIFDGSPPCCSFSICGIREAGWGKIRKYSDTKQRTDDLFFEYIRLVDGIKPKVFVAENTKGLTIGKSKEVLREILRTFSEIGYVAECRVLDASKYGVPEKRERAFIIGVRNDLKAHPVFPDPLPYSFTMREAIEDLEQDGTDLVCSTTGQYWKRMKKYFRPGCSDGDIRKICKENNISVFRQPYRRDRWDKPAYTITAHKDRCFHPRQDRLLSVMEAKRIQTFPDDFQLLHNPVSNWERIGRAVPPSLMMEIAKAIKEKILDGMDDYE